MLIEGKGNPLHFAAWAEWIRWYIAHFKYRNLSDCQFEPPALAIGPRGGKVAERVEEGGSPGTERSVLL